MHVSTAQGEDQLLSSRDLPWAAGGQQANEHQGRLSCVAKGLRSGLE